MSLHPNDALAGISFRPGDCGPKGTIPEAIHAPSCMDAGMMVICYFGADSPGVMTGETLILYFPLQTGIIMCALLGLGKKIYFFGDVNPVTEIVTNVTWGCV